MSSCASVYVCVYIYKHIQEGPWEADNFKLAMLGTQLESPVG